MSEIQILKQYAKHLNVKAGRFNLYVGFHNDELELDVTRLKLELENMKQIISSIESEINK